MSDEYATLADRYVRELLVAEDRQRAIQAAAGCAACGSPVSEMVVKRQPDLTEKVTFVCVDHAPGDETLDAWLARIAG